MFSSKFRGEVCVLERDYIHIRCDETILGSERVRSGRKDDRGRRRRLRRFDVRSEGVDAGRGKMLLPRSAGRDRRRVIDDERRRRHGTLATLVPGDMFDPSTIPPCDLVVAKHVLCDFSDEDVVRALQSFREALSEGGRVVIMDAVLPNGNDLNGKWNAAVSFDVLLMLTGRRRVP
jgi:hypothetical protein